jgi:hypothetical protein
MLSPYFGAWVVGHCRFSPASDRRVHYMGLDASPHVHRVSNTPGCTLLLIEASNACKVLASDLVVFATAPVDVHFDICLINLDGLLWVAFFSSFRNLDAYVKLSEP